MATDYTFDNYRQVFAGKNEDVLDEIRASLLDGVDLSKWIDCDDPYRLQQLRVAKKQGIAEPWVTVLENGDLLRRCRNLYNSGVNLEILDRYITYYLPESYYVLLLDVIEGGYVFPESIHFELIKEPLLPVLLFCLRYDCYDERIFMGDAKTKNHAYYLAKLFKSGFDLTDVVLTKKESFVKELVSNINKTGFSELYSLLDDIRDKDNISLLLKLYSYGRDISKIASFPNYQLDLILTALKEGYNPDSLEQGIAPQSEAIRLYQDLVTNKVKRTKILLKKS